MSDRAADDAISLLRRLVKHLNRKFSDVVLHLLNHKSAGSVGAIAGLAIAVVFTWKFLKSPPGRERRNPPKRRGFPPANGDFPGGTALAAEDSSAVPGWSDSDAIQENGTPYELNLGQIVRRKLGGCRKLTCQLLCVILEEKSPEELQKHATVRSSVVEILLEIAKCCDLYLMERVLDDESEERVLSAMENAGLFVSGGLTRDKLVDIVNQGKLVSDEIIMNLLSKRLQKQEVNGESGFILDGFPRTIRQAEIFEGVTDVDLVVNLKLREDVLVEKCLGRRICSQCGGNFNVACIDIRGENGMPGISMPPLLPPPQCTTKLISRPDDTEEVVKERLRVYYEMSQPVEEFYRSRGKLLEFDLPGGIAESWPKFLQALKLEGHDDQISAAA